MFLNIPFSLPLFDFLAFSFNLGLCRLCGCLSVLPGWTRCGGVSWFLSSTVQHRNWLQVFCLCHLPPLVPVQELRKTYPHSGVKSVSSSSLWNSCRTTPPLFLLWKTFSRLLFWKIQNKFSLPVWEERFSNSDDDIRQI